MGILGLALAALGLVGLDGDNGGALRGRPTGQRATGNGQRATGNRQWATGRDGAGRGRRDKRRACFTRLKGLLGA